MSSKVRPRIAAAVYAACQRAWAAAFGLAGRIGHRTLPRCTLVGVGRVLVIAPHPDDECTGCGGAIALHVRAGDIVSVLQVTDGRSTRASQAVNVRQTEARVAAAALAVATLEQLSLPERDWSEAALRDSLRARLAQFDPQVVYAPSCIDYHPDHLRVARAFAAALDDSWERPRVRCYEVSVPLTVLANCMADTSDVLAAHDAAIAAYRSQALTLRRVARLRTYHARFYRVGQSAELFCELSPRAYRAFIARGDWLGPGDWSARNTPYRSLRDRPFTDPLAYWQGRRARRALKAICEGRAG
jgi:LmbE family N-acetylglucosaminyl deacetylase